MNLQVLATTCLVFLIIQPALTEPIKSYKKLSYDESEHEHARANIHLVQREIIRKSPICDCHSRITKLPTVTIHQIGEPLIGDQSLRRTLHRPEIHEIDAHVDVDDFPAQEDEQEVLLRKLYAKYGKNLSSLESRSREPVSSKRTLRLPQTRREPSEVEDLLEALNSRGRHINEDIDGEEEELAQDPRLRSWNYGKTIKNNLCCLKKF